MRGKRASLLIIVFLSLSVLLSATQYARADTSLVPPPTNLTATAVSSSEIHLSWTAPTAIGLVVSGYEIERSTNGGLTWAVLVTDTGSTATTYADTGLAHTTLYTYRVHTIAPAIGTGSPSNTPSATTLAVAPSSPSGLTATAVSPSQISLSWTAPADNGGSPITGYRIEKSIDGGSTWTTLVGNTGNTATTYSDTGLAHTTTYTYRVSAINSIGTSSASANVPATTLIATPSPPTGLAAATISSSQINLSWTAPTDNGGPALTRYKIARSTHPGTTRSPFENIRRAPTRSSAQ